MMAWIETIDEEEATGSLSEIYAATRDPTSGRVDNILKVHALDPRGLRAHLSVYENAMRSTRTLRKADREMIAVVVSRINECEY